MRGERREDRIGVWVRRPEKGEAFEDKIAAIGIRVTHWVTLHGMALNVDPDLTHFSGIVPCGVSEPRYGVTSLADLGMPVSMPEVDMVLRREFEALFGATVDQNSTENNSPGPAQLEVVFAAVALIERIDAGGERPAPAGFDHVAHDGVVAREHRLDAAVAAIAHPAFQPAPERLVLDEGADSRRPARGRARSCGG